MPNMTVSIDYLYYIKLHIRYEINSSSITLCSPMFNRKCSLATKLDKVPIRYENIHLRGSINCTGFDQTKKYVVI